MATGKSALRGFVSSLLDGWLGTVGKRVSRNAAVPAGHGHGAFPLWRRNRLPPGRWMSDADLRQALKNSVRTVSGRHFVGPSDRAVSDANRIAYRGPNYVLNAHGAPDRMVLFDRDANANDVARLVELDPEIGQRDLLLVSCHTAVGAPSFAADLARLTGKGVVAPGEYAFIDHRGMPTTGNYNRVNGLFAPPTHGKMGTVHPGRILELDGYLALRREMREAVIDTTRVNTTAEWLAERGLVAEYLEGCPRVLTGFGFEPDLIDPSRPARVPIGVATDGTFVWSSALPYYVQEHGVVPPEDLLTHLRNENYRPPSLTLEQLDQALEFLKSDPES